MGTSGQYARLPDPAGDVPIGEEGISLLSSMEADRVRQRRRCCFGRIFLVVGVLCGGVVATAVVVSLGSSSDHTNNSRMQFSDVFNTNLTPRYFTATWLPTSGAGSERLFRRKDGPSGVVELEFFQAASPETPQLLCRIPEELSKMAVAEVTVSPNEQ